MLKNQLNAIFNAEQYHGWGKTKRYFEGWYFKLLSADEQHALAFVPGVAMDEKGNQQAFIQALDGKKLTAVYHKYPFDQFVPQPGKFNLHLANSFFSKEKMYLQLPNIKGELKFDGLTPWPNPWYSPNIMGPFSFLPFMQCYHGILSMNHRIQGALEIDGQVVDFTNGKGYIEKEWGRSFPSGYIWMQTNHFSDPDISLKSSVAKIPYMGFSFVGYIAGLWLHDRLLEFTTYNGTKLRHSFADKQHVALVYENNNYRLEIIAHRRAATALASPVASFMDGRIEESMTSSVDVQLTERRSKKVLLEDTGRHAALAVAGQLEDILVE
jgi:hypothetical protein